MTVASRVRRFLAGVLGVDFVYSAVFAELTGPSATDEAIALLLELPRLETLAIGRGPITNSGLLSVTRLNRLRRLQLHACPGVSDAALRQILLLCPLETLELSDLKVTGEFLDRAMQLDRLECLELSWIPFEEQNAPRIGDLRGLRTLGMAWTGVGDRTITEIGRLERLEHLNLSGTLVSDNGLARLRALRQLRTIDLSRTRITDKGICGFDAHSGLKTMVLAGTQITTGALARIGSISGLNSLDVSGTRIGSGVMDRNALSGIEGLRQLVYLNASDTMIRDDDIRALGTMDSLREVKLMNTRVSDDGSRWLRRTLPLTRFFINEFDVLQ